MNYEKAVDILTSKDKFCIKLGLENVAKALELLNNPQNDLKYIHVAGTNGKGSVCAILASILKEAGYNVGLYTSPHIKKYTERIQINGVPIPDEYFADYIEEVSALNIPLTEFEMLTVVMFLYFQRKHVDYVVLETGMGGRLDATNIIKKNVCAVITQIALDHTERLGNTLDEIAYEKAGIIKENCPTVTSMGYEVIRDKADEENSMLILVSPCIPQEFLDALNLKGLHQIENLALALTVIKYLFKDINDKTIIDGLHKVKHPCRFEYHKEDNLIVDGAHNPNGIEALKKNLDFYFPNQKRRFIFGALRTKDYEKMMKILFEPDDEIYLYGFDYPNACSYEELQSKCPYKNKEYSLNINLTPDKLNIICGSFYMINKVLK